MHRKLEFVTVDCPACLTPQRVIAGRAAVCASCDTAIAPLNEPATE